MMNTILLLGILLILIYQNFWNKIIKIRIKNPIKQWREKAYRKRKAKAREEFDSYRKWFREYYGVEKGQLLEEFQSDMILDKVKELNKRYNVKMYDE